MIYTQGTVMKVQHTDAKSTGILGTSQSGKKMFWKSNGMMPVYFRLVLSEGNVNKQKKKNHLLNMNTKLSHKRKKGEPLKGLMHHI